MQLAEMTWKEVDALSRDTVVVIPTGALEQHGPHLPLFTDSLIVTAVCNAVEAQISDKILVTPCLWLGASAHHLPFAGTASASMTGYMEALTQVIESLERHEFHRFVVINGHGGNHEPNGVALRMLKARKPNLTLGHSGYYQFGAEVTARLMEGQLKTIQHACEAETSLMLHLHPGKVRTQLVRNDGLRATTPASMLVKSWDEISEEGGFGFAAFGTAEKGKEIFEACVAGIVAELVSVWQGVAFEGIF